PPPRPQPGPAPMSAPDRDPPTSAEPAGPPALRLAASRWRDVDWPPLLLVPALAFLALPFVGSPSTWVTLTVAGLAMGMMIFIMASGLTLVFGLMDVLNF